MESLEQMIRNRTRHRLPEPLDGDTHFTWGPVVELHKLPRFNTVIVEYKPQIFDENGHATKTYSDEHNYHLHGTSSSFTSLEAAIIFAISKHNKVSDSFARAACHLLKADSGCIKIEVQGGCVQEVTGLPDGWLYEINDLDVRDED